MPTVPISDADWAEVQAKHGFDETDRRFFAHMDEGYAAEQIDEAAAQLVALQDGIRRAIREDNESADEGHTDEQIHEAVAQHVAMLEGIRRAVREGNESGEPWILWNSGTK